MKILRMLSVILPAALLLVGCDKEEAPKIVSEVSLADTNQTSQAVAKGSNVVFEMKRTNPQNTINVKIEATRNDENKFTIPSTVEFPAGKESVTVEVPFKGESVDESYTMAIRLRTDPSNATYTASGSLSITATVVPLSYVTLEIVGPEVEVLFPGQTLEFTMKRSGTTALTVPLIVESNEANVYSIPSSVAFASGETEKKFEVGVSADASFGATYGFKLKASDGANKYTDSSGEPFEFDWSHSMVDGYTTLKYSQGGMNELEVGATMSVNITLDRTVDEAISIPITVVENQSSVYEIPEYVRIEAGGNSGVLSVKLKKGTEAEKEYTFAVRAENVGKYMFKSENSYDQPVYRNTLKATMGVIQARFDTSTAATLVPGTFTTLAIVITVPREVDIEIPLVLDNDGGGMFSIPSSVTIAANTDTGFFKVSISENAVPGTTYRIGYSVGESSEYNIVKENAISPTDRPVITNKAMRITAGWAPYAKCSAKSGYLASLGYPQPYEVIMFHNSTEGTYRIAAPYLKAGASMNFTWDGGETIAVAGQDYTTPDGTITKGWMFGWGYGLACTPIDPDEVYYTPATKTFTLRQYFADGMTGEVYGWFTDTFEITETY